MPSIFARGAFLWGLDNTPCICSGKGFGADGNLWGQTIKGNMRMKNAKPAVQWAYYSAVVFLSIGLLAGCQSGQTGSASDSKAAGGKPAPAVVKAPEATPSPAAPAP